jgi:hypothetical protein
MDQNQLEQRLVLHEYTREREKCVERSPELKDCGSYIDVETLRLSNEEMSKFGRVVSGPKELARKAAENVKKNLRQQGSRETAPSRDQENQEFADIFINMNKRARRPPKL